jgi:hypothetical protein
MTVCESSVRRGISTHKAGGSRGQLVSLLGKILLRLLTLSVENLYAHATLNRLISLNAQALRRMCQQAGM